MWSTVLTRKLWVFLYLTLAKSQYPAPSAHYSSIRPPGVTPNPAVYQQGGAPQQSELSSWQEAVFLFVYTVTNWKAWKRVDYYQSLHRKWGCQYAVFPPLSSTFTISFFSFWSVSLWNSIFLLLNIPSAVCDHPSISPTHTHALPVCHIFFLVQPHTAVLYIHLQSVKTYNEQFLFRTKSSTFNSSLSHCRRWQMLGLK